MNLKEYADKKNITISQAKKETGLTHWKQEVVEDASEEKPVAKKPKKETKTQSEKKVLALQQEATKLRTYLGERNEKYLKHVSCYRDLLPAEYHRAKENIKIYL